MPQRSLKKYLPYAPEQLFALVADIERYPSFLPWCQNVLVLERHKDGLVAELVVGKGSATAKTRSYVRFQKPQSIVIANDDSFEGILKSLSGIWTFLPARTPATMGCEVGFALDFLLHSPVLNALAPLMLDEAFERIIHAFEAQAKALYAKSLNKKALLI